MSPRSSRRRDPALGERAGPVEVAAGELGQPGDEPAGVRVEVELLADPGRAVGVRRSPRRSGRAGPPTSTRQRSTCTWSMPGAALDLGEHRQEAGPGLVEPVVVEREPRGHVLRARCGSCPGRARPARASASARWASCRPVPVQRVGDGEHGQARGQVLGLAGPAQQAYGALGVPGGHRRVGTPSARPGRAGAAPSRPGRSSSAASARAAVSTSSIAATPEPASSSSASRTRTSCAGVAGPSSRSTSARCTSSAWLPGAPVSTAVASHSTRSSARAQRRPVGRQQVAARWRARGHRWPAASAADGRQRAGEVGVGARVGERPVPHLLGDGRRHLGELAVQLGAAAGRRSTSATIRRSAAGVKRSASPDAGQQARPRRRGRTCSSASSRPARSRWRTVGRCSRAA